MHKDKKQILYTIGGAAVIAGAFIYFKRRNMTTEQKYLNLFRQLSQDLLSFKQLNQSNYQLRYDKLLYLAIYDENDNLRTVAEKISFQESEELKNQGACNQQINVGACYYECFDCSPPRQENAKTNKSIDDNVICQAICEDCFKAQGHKNHKFIRHEYFGFGYDRCQCGIQSIVDKKCFCNQHQGFDKIKQLCNDQLQKQPKIWKGVEQFLIDSFYYYFEIVSDAIRQKLDKTIDEKTYNQQLVGINYFLQLIINKINEIIELNTPSTYLITRILSMPFDKPISFEVKRNGNEQYPNKYTRLIQQKKQINKKLTILDCLLLTYEVFDNQNDELLSNFFRSISIADEAFSAVTCETFFRMIGFIARTQKSQNEWINNSKLPTFTHLVMENVFIQSIFDHIIDKLGLDILNPIEYITFYIQNQNVKLDDLDQTIMILPNICFDMFRFVNQLKVILQRYPKESIKAINDLSFALFFSNYIRIDHNLIKQKSFQEDSIKSIKALAQYAQVELQAIDSYVNISEGLLLINDHTLTQNVINILCDSFKEYIIELSDQIEENGNFYTFSIALLSQLPFLIAASEKKIFTKSSIQNFFNTKFNFQDKEEKTNFFKCLRKTVSNFALSINQEINILLQYLSDKFQQLETDIQNSLEQIDYYFYNPFNKVYDIYQISTSICFLAEDCDNLHTQNIHIQKFLTTVQNFKQDENESVTLTCISQYAICQMLLDSTPFFNLFSKKIKLFFPELNQKEDTLIKKIIKKNVEEVIVSCIQENQLDKMYLNDLKQICSRYINDQDIVQEYYLGVVNQSEKQEYISLKQQYSQKLYSRHLIRNQMWELDKIIKSMALKNQGSTEEYTYAGSDFNLENLFPYQQDLLKKIILNDQFAFLIIATQKTIKYSLLAQRSINDIFFMLLKLIIQSNQSQILRVSEKKQIEKLIQIVPFNKIKDKYITDIKYLKENQLYEWLKTSEIILEMIYQLEQPIK
ncbi:hypothetical protein ABPG72_017456 [Tetrahymena utriculariae]